MAGGRRLPLELRRYLDTHRIGHLATADARGAPHAVPLCYARIGHVLYFVADNKPKRGTPKELKRLHNIAENPRAALVVDHYEEDWSRLSFALLHLDAEPVRNAREYRRALAALRKRYPQYRSMRLAQSTNPIMRLTPRRWTFWQSA